VKSTGYEAPHYEIFIIFLLLPFCSERHGKTEHSLTSRKRTNIVVRFTD